ncbi:unnamed protein product [Parascedosporium putredinis]|uniref:Uncharacterized protein n=1 Tax=Parascedosporium putredinis TaxID=1442378 RepID=A0A9P1MAL1_9PEZI|nr:unnamed protein product [Parascedosporium putredinis]CAI7994365.1 unnamed protein product [Parascedosporium putredinis]
MVRYSLLPSRALENIPKAVNCQSSSPGFFADFLSASKKGTRTTINVKPGTIPIRQLTNALHLLHPAHRMPPRVHLPSADRNHAHHPGRAQLALEGLHVQPPRLRGAHPKLLDRAPPEADDARGLAQRAVPRAREDLHARHARPHARLQEAQLPHAFARPQLLREDRLPRAC